MKEKTHWQLRVYADKNKSTPYRVLSKQTPKGAFTDFTAWIQELEQEKKIGLIKEYEIKIVRVKERTVKQYKGGKNENNKKIDGRIHKHKG